MPWIAIAVPLDAPSFDWEGAENARWRVFLPLGEEGPSACILNAAAFVDPSRRAVEFRTDGSDETLRKSQWNGTLVERLLVPLLRDASTMVLDNAPQLIEQEPKKYLSLLPYRPKVRRPGPIVSHRRCTRRLLGRTSGSLNSTTSGRYRSFFEVGPGQRHIAARESAGVARTVQGELSETLTTDARRFVAWTVGGAVDERLGYGGNVAVKKTGADVPDRVLLAGQSPRAEDLQRLLKLLGEEQLDASSLQEQVGSSA